MSENLDRTDKILLSPGDSKEMSEFFTRLNPGDEVSGTFKCTLDEAGQKIVVLSIQEIEIDKPKDDDDAPMMADDDDDNEEGEEKEPALMMMKNDEGVPSQEDNTPPDVIPTH